MRIKKIVGLSMLLALCLASGYEMAAAGARGRGPAHQGPEMLERLDLSAEQKNEIDALRENAQGDMLKMRKELRRLRHAMKGEMLADEPDLGQARSLTSEIGQLRTQMDLRRLEQRWAIRQVLTPAQRDRLFELRIERERRGPRGSQPPMPCKPDGPPQPPRGRGHHHGW